MRYPHGRPTKFNGGVSDGTISPPSSPTGGGEGEEEILGFDVTMNDV